MEENVTSKLTIKSRNWGWKSSTLSVFLMNLNIVLLKAHRNVHFNGLSNTLRFISNDIKCLYEWCCGRYNIRCHDTLKWDLDKIIIIMV